MNKPLIAIASEHARHDLLEQAVARRLPTYRVIRLRTKKELSDLAQAQELPELIFFPHWSWMIPEAIYARITCVMFHMTDLPYGRGGSPLQNLIVRGHSETKLSAFRCEQLLDGGEVYLKRSLSLGGTAEDILRRASELMEKMIVEIVDRRPTPTPQEGDATEFLRRKPEDGDLRHLTDLSRVYDFIRMLDAVGYPPAFIESQSFRLEFTDAKLGDEWVEAKVRFKAKSHE